MRALRKLWSKSARVEDEIDDLVATWCQSLLDKDAETATRLRTDAYLATMPSGAVLTRDEEVALIASPELDIEALDIENIRAGVLGESATATAIVSIRYGHVSQPASIRHRYTFQFERTDEVWRAPASRLEVLSLPEGSEAIPLEELWLGRHYLNIGKAQVATMRVIAEASGLALDHARILDFGCGKGRMIRHLHDLAETCEVWGTDIKPEHIAWCAQHLTPPFHFVTTPRSPELPFEDGSFRFIYCASVFTEIDDRVDDWLRELRRIAAPDGRVYVTIHDSHTVELMESAPSAIARRLLAHRAYPIYKESGTTLVLDSQVFYDRHHFLSRTRTMFDVASITEEAHFQETAILLTPK
jgi:ubiquinone/menaquinone biosynthesis C-methylase UbiE